jgi:hypothetical protein
MWKMARAVPSPGVSPTGLALGFKGKEEQENRDGRGDL